MFYSLGGNKLCLRMRQETINLEGTSYVQKERKKKKENSKSESAKRNHKYLMLFLMSEFTGCSTEPKAHWIYVVNGKEEGKSF